MIVANNHALRRRLVRRRRIRKISPGNLPQELTLTQPKRNPKILPAPNPNEDIAPMAAKRYAPPVSAITGAYQWVRLAEWGFLLVFYSIDSPKMHRLELGAWDKQTVALTIAALLNTP